MLLRFRVANALSLRDEQELSFVVPQGEDAPTARALKLSDGKTLDVYPLLGIFGANAFREVERPQLAQEDARGRPAATRRHIGVSLSHTHRNRIAVPWRGAGAR